MPEHTPHGQTRHQQEDRPTEEAFRDRDNPEEIYEDQQTGNLIYVGPRGRTHVFLPDGRHHTSFRTTKSNRQLRVQTGKWMRVWLEE
jgi:hypothetical protein